MHRRDFIIGSLGLSALGGLRAAVAKTPWDAENGAAFDPGMVRELARQLAQSSYKAPDDPLPSQLKDLSYDAYRAIRFLPANALWRGANLPFEVQFFHRGFLFADRVSIYEVSEGRAQAVRYSPNMFTFGEASPPQADASFGFAGFRLHGRINRSDYHDEVATFLGASYFRAVAKGQTFGLSARGLSINTGEPKGEEFPGFRSFWIEKPQPGAQACVVHALLDSASATGAYRFTIRPGETTVSDVEVALYPRTEIAQPGLATLTSMFFFDAHDRDGIDDFRPAVHDSGGLAMETGTGERLWRPLANPRELQVSSFGDTLGYGLSQRNRAFHLYEDLEARYERRPTAWVEPIGNWGEGQVLLYEIPTKNEYNDNVVVFWRPKEKLQAKREYGWTYRLHWVNHDPNAGERAVFVRTRQGSAPENRRLFVLDAIGDNLKKLPPNTEVRGEVKTDKGKIHHVVTQPNPHTGGWRLSFQLAPEKAGTVELRARLMREQEPVSETWVYRWTS